MIFFLKKGREHAGSANRFGIIQTIPRLTNMIICLLKQENIISKN